MPGFEDRLRRRWSELRRRPLAEAALDARIDEMARHLSGYMDWEYALLRRATPPTYEDKVEELRQGVKSKLAHMDSRLAATPPDAGGGE